MLKKEVKIFFHLCFMLHASFFLAQVNLVPNPSFENTVSCPFSFGLESYVQNWRSARATPDYFNSCATWTGASSPKNDYGYQTAYTGSAYVGMLTYRTDSSIYTEAIGVQLSQPLQVGVKYYVTFQVSLTLESSTGSMAANNKIGVQFSTIGYSPTNQIAVNNFAHFYTDSIITDTIAWTNVSGSFVADSAYNYLNLGNFFDKPYIDSIIYGATFGAYYYFDNICVSSDSLTCNQSQQGINQMNNDQSLFKIYPNPSTDYFYIKKNIPLPYDLIIYDILGQKLYEEKNIILANTLINTTEFCSGLLLISIKTENEKLNYKLLKTH